MVITNTTFGFLTVIFSVIVMSRSDQEQNRTGIRTHSCHRSNAVDVTGSLNFLWVSSVLTRPMSLKDER